MSCNNCGFNPCRCGARANCGCSSATPLPLSVNCCEQPACAPEPCDLNVGGFKISSSFQMPLCNGSASVVIDNLINAPVGAYLWAAGVGYLQIVSADLSTGVVVLQNNCTTGNAAPGTTIVACTVFVATPPPAESPGGGSQTGIFVAIDFTAPADSTCILITVTAVEGLAVGKDVGIGSGVYRLQAVNDSTHITICNDGDGITPGSSVIAKNGTGQYQYPITLIDANPCTNPPVVRATVLGCKDGIAQPFETTEVGQILVVVDAETNEFEARFLGVPTRTCATLLCCLTLVPGTLVYIISVSDSSEFEVGDILQVGSRTDRFTVDVIIDATHIQATINTNPSSVQTIAEATSICIVDCCEDLQNQIDTINTEIAAIPCAPLGSALVDSAADPASTGSSSSDETVNSGAPGALCPVGGIAQWTIENSSDCRNMVASFLMQSKFVGDASGGNISAAFSQVLTIDGGAPAAITENRSFDSTIGNGVNDVVINTPLTITLTPAQIVVVNITSAVLWLNGGGDYNIRDWENRIVGMATT